MNKILLAAVTVVTLFIGQKAACQDISVMFIPDSLSKNANAIVRNYDISFIQNDVNSGVEKVSKTITILNSKGDKNAFIVINQDKFHELTDFSGVIKDALGNVIRKIKKGDLTTSSFSEAFASDDKYSFYECRSPSYPFTVEYSYQIKYKNGILHYPGFFPMESHSQSIQTASYQIEIPANISLRYKSVNLDQPVEMQEMNGKKIYSCKITGFKAVNYEPIAPIFKDYMPYIIFAPNEFCYDGFCGNMSDWNNYGKWVSDLLVGRDRLSPDFTEKIRVLTENAQTNKEKAKILYKYLQENTRYVSIQLGIGGFRPAPASDVQKTGFGDCKGLSNFMKAMLNAINIPSNYSVIKYDVEEKRVFSDFPNFIQFNHVILSVPFEKDTVWLECTSNSTPFGFIHKGIAGHDALVISDAGGTLCRLPAYPDSLNKTITTLNISLSEEGHATGKALINNYLHEYPAIASLFETNNTKEQTDYLAKKMKPGKVKIQNITSIDNKAAYPDIQINYDFIAEDFANKSNNRLFVPVCPINKGNYKIFTSTKREQDIVINEGYNEIDRINIQIPKGYVPESLPENITINTPYGIYTSSVKFEEGTLKYSQNILIFTKRHPKEEYKEIKAFYEKINAALSRTIVLKRGV